MGTMTKKMQRVLLRIVGLTLFVCCSNISFTAAVVRTRRHGLWFRFMHDVHFQVVRSKGAEKFMPLDNSSTPKFTARRSTDPLLKW